MIKHKPEIFPVGQIYINQHNVVIRINGAKPYYRTVQWISQDNSIDNVSVKFLQGYKWRNLNAAEKLERL